MSLNPGEKTVTTVTPTGLPAAGLPFPVLRLDSEGIIRESNGVLERDLGAEPRTLLACRLADIASAAALPVEEAVALARDEHRTVCLRFNASAGRYQREFSTVSDVDGIWLIGLPPATEADREALRAKSEFLETMSHELRTPLNAVLGYAGLLRDGIYGAVTDKQKRAIQSIVRRAKDLQLLIDDVLDLSSIESGRSQMLLSDFHPADVLVEICNDVASLATERGIRVIVQDASPGSVRLDRDKYKHAVANLVSNAIKFTEPQGEVELSVETAGESTFLTRVRDTGIGIPAHKLDRIFDSFKQIETGTTRRHGGMGLGLALVRRTVDAMGGTVTVESEEGFGTTFCLTLPVRPDVGAMCGAVETALAERVSDERIVLAIDDDPEVIALLRDSLTPDYRVVGALSGDRGIELARILNPFAITLDIMMPRKNGWQVLREIKADPEIRDIPVVITSIVSEPALGFSLGVADYLVKPVDRDVLLGVLSRIGEHAGRP